MKLLVLVIIIFSGNIRGDEDTFDPFDFQRRFNQPGFVNGTHSISGAAFTPEPPVVLVRSIKTIWTYIPFPQIPQLDPEPLNEILDNALARLVSLDIRMFHHECVDPHLFEYWKRFLRDNLAEIFQSHKMFQQDWLAMRRALTVFLNHTVDDIPLEKPNRYSRSIVGTVAGSMIGSELAHVFLRPIFGSVTDKISCFVDDLIPFGSVCRSKEREIIEELAREIKVLQDEVVYLRTELLEAITVRLPADVEGRKLLTLKQSLDDNIKMLNSTVNGVIDEITDYVEKAECVVRLTQDRHRNTLIIAAAFQNLTTQYKRIVNDINQRRISLSNMASMLQEAMSSLVHGYLPISLIPPSTLKKILDSYHVTGLNEAIPRKLIAAYYSFEIVRDAYVTDEGLHMLLEIPMYAGHGIHEVYRATPIPQPIPNSERATQYQLTKTHLLMSWDKTNFAEVTEQELSTHCWGSHRLRLCKQPFSTTKSQKTTCLTGLFFNLPATVLKLCAQEVVALPQHPQAIYLYESTYLLTSAKGDFTMQNMTGTIDYRVPGCQSCLVRPTCEGRLQLPNAGLFLTPDPVSCATGKASEIVRIMPTPLLRPLFENLKDLEEVIPPSLMGDVHQELLSHLKLNLAGLPDRAITEEMLDAIAKPFLTEVEKVHSTVIKKVWKDIVLPCVVTLIVLILFALLCWAIKKGQLFLMQRCIQRVLGWRRRGGEETDADRLARIAEQLQNLPTTSAREEVKTGTGDSIPTETKKPKPHPK